MSRRNLKSQIRRDVKRVFLNLNDFAALETIRYYRNGSSKPPEERKIPVVIDEDTNRNSVWNRTQNWQKINNDQTLFQLDLIIFCALKDFSPPPKKGNELDIGDRAYRVSSVAHEYGMLKIELRELEE